MAYRCPEATTARGWGPMISVSSPPWASLLPGQEKRQGQLHRPAHSCAAGISEPKASPWPGCRALLLYPPPRHLGLKHSRTRGWNQDNPELQRMGLRRMGVGSSLPHLVYFTSSPPPPPGHQSSPRPLTSWPQGKLLNSVLKTLVSLGAREEGVPSSAVGRNGGMEMDSSMD